MKNNQRNVRLHYIFGSNLQKRRWRFLSLTGFTFIELMLVVVIVGIIVGLSTPLFRKTFANVQLSNLSQSIAKLMRYAQERAIVERTKYRINFDFDRGKYWLTTKKDPLTSKEFQRIEGRFGRICAIPRGISIEGEEEGITFYPDGISDEVSIYIINRNQKVYTLTTQNRIGHVKIIEGRQKE